MGKPKRERTLDDNEARAISTDDSRLSRAS
jgi:hypothetical protein